MSSDVMDSGHDLPKDRLYELFVAMRQDRSFDRFIKELELHKGQVWEDVLKKCRHGDYAEDAIQAVLLTVMRRTAETEYDSKLTPIDGPEALIDCLRGLAKQKIADGRRENRHGWFLPGNDPTAPTEDEGAHRLIHAPVRQQIHAEMRSLVDQIRERVVGYLGRNRRWSKATALVVNKELGFNRMSIQEIAAECGMASRTVDRVIEKLRAEVDLEALIADGRRKIGELYSRLMDAPESTADRGGVG